jgi:hypothetical protein
LINETSVDRQAAPVHVEETDQRVVNPAAFSPARIRQTRSTFSTSATRFAAACRSVISPFGDACSVADARRPHARAALVRRQATSFEVGNQRQPPGEVLSRRKSGISAASASTAATLHFLTIDFTNSPFIESERCQIAIGFALKPVIRQRGKNGASAAHVKRHLFGGHCPDIRQPTASQ